MNNEQFRAIRHYKKMTQREFADWLGVSIATIAKIEAGHMDISDSIRWRLAHKFDASSPDFIEYIKKREQVDDYFNWRKVERELFEKAREYFRNNY